MTELNRRDVIRGVVVGAAVAGGATAATPARVPSRRELLQQRREAEARGVVQRQALPGAACGLSSVVAATVSMCRSWDGQVYVVAADGAAGFCALDARGFTVASAAQAAGRSLFVRHWGHDELAEGGLGRFAGVLLAFDAEDLGGTTEVQPWA